MIEQFNFENWSTYSLADIANYHNGYAFKPSDWAEEGTKIIRIEQLNNPDGSYDYFSGSFPLINSIKDGDLIFSWSATLKVVIWKHGPAVLNQHLFRVDEKNGFDKKFIYYLLDYNMDYLSGGSHGSTMKHIKRGELNKFKVKIPELCIQRKISHILSVLDCSIEETEKLIKKYSKVRTGMMCDFFTRGVNSDHKLRQSYEHAPDLYQGSEIGFIPKEWSTSRIDKLLAPMSNNFRSGPFGSALLKSELVEEGIPFLGIENIHIEHFNATFRRFVSEQKFNELIKYAVRPRDVVITIMGTVGRSSVIPDDVGFALSSKHLWTMTFDQDLVIPDLVCWQLNYAPWVKFWFRKETQGGIMDAIQSKTLKSLILPIPPMHEQNLIYENYLVITKKIQTEKKKLNKLLEEKKGLMNDLLTGKVSVQSKLNDTEALYV